MSKDERIDRRNADPEVLRAYNKARNERRASNYLMPMALGGQGVLFLTIIILLLGFPASSGYTKVFVLLGVTGFYLITCFTLMVMWSQSGKRLRNLGIIVGFVAGLAILVALGQLLMDAVLL